MTVVVASGLHRTWTNPTLAHQRFRQGRHSGTSYRSLPDRSFRLVHNCEQGQRPPLVPPKVLRSVGRGNERNRERERRPKFRSYKRRQTKRPGIDAPRSRITTLGRKSACPDSPSWASVQAGHLAQRDPGPWPLGTGRLRLDTVEQTLCRLYGMNQAQTIQRSIEHALGSLEPIGLTPCL
jgi:hypothetical protein